MQIHIGLSNACNLKCKHCFVKDKNVINLNQVKVLELIDRINSTDLVHLYYTYGEPLLVNNFYEFSSKIKDMKIYQILMTNGTLIDENNVRKIKSSGINQVMVSFDSSEKDEHDRNRGAKGSFDKAINAIRLLKAENVKVGIATTVTESNFESLSSIKVLGNSLHVDCLSFLAERQNGKIVSPLSWDYIKLLIGSLKEKENIIFHDLRLIPLVTYLRKLGVLSEEEYLKACNMNRCSIMNTLSISPTGDIYRCNFINNKAIANINELSVNEFVDVINSERITGCTYEK